MLHKRSKMFFVTDIKLLFITHFETATAYLGKDGSLIGSRVSITRQSDSQIHYQNQYRTF